MKLLKLLIALLTAAALLAGCAGAEDGPLGQEVPNFTAQTIDGDTFTLSEALRQYDAVLINLWASWCGYCVNEFPYLQEAYEQYRDRVAVIALSVEPRDTPEAMREFAADLGLTFPIAQDPDGLLDAFSRSVSIPTSMLVDRFGRVGFYWVGALPSASAFMRLFDYFISDEYTQTVLLTGIPGPRPTDLTGAAGGALDFLPLEDDAVWPMTTAEIDGRGPVLTVTNSGQAGTEAAACARVDAAAGDALAFAFRTDTFPALDYLYVSVDGDIVKRFSGTHDWTSWAVALPEGSHTVTFGYSRNSREGAGQDSVWIDSVRLISGAEAAEQLAQLPAVPRGDAFGIEVVTPGARQVRFNDPAGVIRYFFNSDTAWIVGAPQAELRLTLTAENDPETAFVYLPARQLTPDRILRIGAGQSDILVLDLPADDPLPAQAYSGVSDAELESPLSLLLFADEGILTDLLRSLTQSFGVEVTYEYAQAETASLPGEAVYTVRVVDQHGDPVPGCIVNFCSDSACMPVMTGDDGSAAFAGAPYAYHLQVIRVPEGYAFDTSLELYADPRGGEITLTAEKQ